MSLTKRRFTDMINYRHFIDNVTANFGYDGDCDNGQMIDATNYDEQIDYWLSTIDINENNEDYDFLYNALYIIVHDWIIGINSKSNCSRVNQFLDDYKKYLNEKGE